MQINQCIIKQNKLITVISDNSEQQAYNITIKNMNSNKTIQALLKINDENIPYITTTVTNQYQKLTKAETITLKLLVTNVEYFFYQLSRKLIEHPQLTEYLKAESIISETFKSEQRIDFHVHSIPHAISVTKDNQIIK